MSIEAIIRWLFDHDRWEFVTKLHLTVLALLMVGVLSASLALLLTPNRWLGVASLALSVAGTYQSRISDEFLREQEHFWDKTKFPHGPPSFWMRNVTMDDSVSWRARARRALFQNPNVGNAMIGVGGVLGLLALFW